ncbi:hypothetical protein VTL71DRAFT_2263 [Oculimacula yallundae]|uniref:Uncharacterized protein n=1 Tax=Oculimacula yallundae TaxID=86028 RepID=A0ABR4C955_9HELO
MGDKRMWMHTRPCIQNWSKNLHYSIACIILHRCIALYSINRTDTIMNKRRMRARIRHRESRSRLYQNGMDQI